MRALKTVLNIATWLLLFSLLGAAIYYVRTAPPSTPDEIKSGSILVAALGGLIAVIFGWKILAKKPKLNFYTVFNYFRAVAITHLGVLWFAAAYFGWWRDGQGSIATAAVFDTALNGALFNAFGSFNIKISAFEPETGVFYWQLIKFIFGMAYTPILAAIGFVLHKGRNTKREQE